MSREQNDYEHQLCEMIKPLRGAKWSTDIQWSDLTRRRVKDEEFYYGWAGRVTRDVGIYSRLLGFFE